MSQRPDLELHLQAISELERRHRAAPLLYYQPHGKQRTFHDMARCVRRRLFLGGNRSGKTTGGRHEAVAHAYGYRYWEVPDLKLGPDGDLPPRDQIPTVHWIRRHDGIPVRVPNVGAVISGLPRQKGIGQNIWPALESMLPERTRSRLRVIRSAGGVPEFCDLPNGSRIIFLSEEMDDMVFEGWSADWAWVDEPIRQSIYSALWARLFDYQGSIWFTLTPLAAKCAWMYQSMYLERPKDVGVVEVSMADNPVNTAAMIADFEKNGEYSDQEKRARLYGTFEFLGNRVLSRFDPQVHICKAFLPPQTWIHGLAVDPHHKRPAFMLWFAYNPHSKTYHFYREWPTENFFKMKEGGLTPVEYATLIRNAEGAIKVHARICDPRFGKAEHQRHGFHETSWVDLMRQQGLYFDANVPNVGTIDYGHQQIDALMRYDKNFPIGPTNHPRIYVHEGLANLQTALMNYAFIDAKDTKSPYQTVSEEFKDPADCLRYAILYPLPPTDDQYAGLQRYSEDDLADANSY